MLQQMLAEDKCEQIRCVCSKSLAMVINELDDETRLSQVNIIVHVNKYRVFIYLSALNYLIDVCRTHLMLSNRLENFYYRQLLYGV